MKVKVYQYIHGEEGSRLGIPPHNMQDKTEFVEFVVKSDTINRLPVGYWMNNSGAYQLVKLDNGTAGIFNAPYTAYDTIPCDTADIKYTIKANDGIYVNDTLLTITGGRKPFGTFSDLWGALMDGEWIKYVKVDTLHLVPCLTESNEACMIDLLTGELYRNQGSGNFSVEGEMLYEFETPSINRVTKKPSVVVRLREWLRGERTKTYLYLGEVEHYCEFTADIPENIGQTQFVYGLNGMIRTSGVGTNHIVYNFTDSNNVRQIPNIIKFRLDFDKEKIYANDEYFGSTLGSSTNPGSRFKQAFINGDSTESIKWTRGYSAFSKVDIDGHIYHPCDLLLHPTLPPQSAMIDPSTGTIYTNQGSGNFTCEGADLGIWTDTMFDDMRIKDVKADMVCIMQNGEPRVVYERTQPFIEHKWLTKTQNNPALIRIVRNIGAIKDFKISLMYNDDSTLVGRAMRIYGNDGELGVCRHEQGSVLRIYPHPQNGSISDYAMERGKSFVVKYTSEGGFSVNATLSNIFSASFAIPQNATTLELLYREDSGWVHSFDSDDLNLHLTPCQLTRNLFPHEIASSNTALRGECGFADKEKYRKGEPWYYGNIAKQGKLGVSDE